MKNATVTIPIHPSAMLTLKQIAVLAGICDKTARKRLPAWRANGLKVVEIDTGNRVSQQYMVRLRDWDTFCEKMIKSEKAI